MKTIIIIIVLVAICLPAAARADGERIVEIEIIDNTKTNDETVRVIADVSVGATFSYALSARIEQDLVSSGLFKEVKITNAPSSSAPGLKLTISARDKHSWIIAPTIYSQPGNVGGGVGFGENNLFGENKKLLLYGQYATADSLFIAVYLDPSIAGSRYFYWRVDTFLRHEKVTEYGQAAGVLEAPEPHRVSTLNYLNAGLLLGANLWKGLALDGRLRGAKVFFSDPHCVDDSLAADCVQDPQDEGYDVSTEVKLTYDKRSNWYGVSTGNMFRLSWERALPDLGSSYDYWMGSVAFNVARKYWSRHNLILKGGLSYGHQLPFQQEYTSGGVNLRGYENRQFRGDFKVGGTFEYSVPFFTIGPVAFRGLAFTDMAYTTFLAEDADNPQRHYIAGQTDSTLEQFRLGVGAGFRIYVRSIVLPLLGVDWGYAPQTNDYHIYFAVGLTEL